VPLPDKKAAGERRPIWVVPGVAASATAVFLGHALAEGSGLQSAHVYYARPPEHLTLLLGSLDVRDGRLEEAAACLVRTVSGFARTTDAAADRQVARSGLAGPVPAVASDICHRR